MGEDLADLISNISPWDVPYYSTSIAGVTACQPIPASLYDAFERGADPETLHVEALPPTKLTRFKRRPYRTYT
jgi:hypothetical protein